MSHKKKVPKGRQKASAKPAPSEVTRPSNYTRHRPLWQNVVRLIFFSIMGFMVLMAIAHYAGHYYRMLTHQ